MDDRSERSSSRSQQAAGRWRGRWEDGAWQNSREAGRKPLKDIDRTARSQPVRADLGSAFQLVVGRRRGYDPANFPVIHLAGVPWRVSSALSAGSWSSDRLSLRGALVPVARWRTLPFGSAMRNRSPTRSSVRRPRLPHRQLLGILMASPKLTISMLDLMSGRSLPKPPPPSAAGVPPAAGERPEGRRLQQRPAPPRPSREWALSSPWRSGAFCSARTIAASGPSSASSSAAGWHSALITLLAVAGSGGGSSEGPSTKPPSRC